VSESSVAITIPNNRIAVAVLNFSTIWVSECRAAEYRWAIWRCC